MKVSFSNINFGNKTETKCFRHFVTSDEYNDSNILIKHSEYDVFHDRLVRQDKYDASGNAIENWWFEYSENKQVEHFKSKNKESYVRTIINKIVDGINTRIEEFVSETNPAKNYIHEVSKNAEGKIVKFICNGKKII